MGVGEPRVDQLQLISLGVHGLQEFGYVVGGVFGGEVYLFEFGEDVKGVALLLCD